MYPRITSTSTAGALFLHPPDVPAQRETTVKLVPVQLADRLRTLLRFRQRREEFVEVWGVMKEEG